MRERSLPDFAEAQAEERDADEIDGDEGEVEGVETRGQDESNDTLLPMLMMQSIRIKYFRCGPRRTFDEKVQFSKNILRKVFEKL